MSRVPGGGVHGWGCTGLVERAYRHARGREGHRGLVLSLLGVWVMLALLGQQAKGEGASLVQCWAQLGVGLCAGPDGLCSKPIGLGLMGLLNGLIGNGLGPWIWTWTWA